MFAALITALLTTLVYLALGYLYHRKQETVVRRLLRVSEEQQARLDDIVYVSDRNRRLAEDADRIHQRLISERDNAWALYQKSAYEASVAQSWLFREMQRAWKLYADVCKAHDIEPKPMDARTEAMVERYRSEHTGQAAPWKEPSEKTVSGK